jgi:hypothetical protein
MNEKYVVSRELAEKLKEAGYRQYDTQFMFDEFGNLERGMGSFEAMKAPAVVYAAPLSDELLERLPETLQSPRGYLWRLSIKPLGSGWTVEYENHAWLTSNRSARKRMGYTDDEIEALAYGAGPFYKDTFTECPGTALDLV